MNGRPRRPRVAAIQQTLCAAGTDLHVHFFATLLTSGYFGAGSLSLTGDLIDKLHRAAQANAPLRLRRGRGRGLVLRHLAAALRADLHREVLQARLARPARLRAGLRRAHGLLRRDDGYLLWHISTLLRDYLQGLRALLRDDIEQLAALLRRDNLEGLPAELRAERRQRRRGRPRLRHDQEARAARIALDYEGLTMRTRDAQPAGLRADQGTGTGESKRRATRRRLTRTGEELRAHADAKQPLRQLFHSRSLHAHNARLFRRP
jgi:hypothetical protein